MIPLGPVPAPSSAQRTSLPKHGFGISNLFPNTKPLRLAHVAIPAGVGLYRELSSRCCTQSAEKEPHSGTNNSVRNCTIDVVLSCKSRDLHRKINRHIQSLGSAIWLFRGCICTPLDCTWAAWGDLLYFDVPLFRLLQPAGSLPLGAGYQPVWPGVEMQQAPRHRHPQRLAKKLHCPFWPRPQRPRNNAFLLLEAKKRAQTRDGQMEVCASRNF